MDQPLGLPPHGVKSNFDNPETLEVAGHVAMGLCIALGAIFTTLRLYVKFFITKLYGWDDFWCVLSWISIVAHDAVAITLMGSGRRKILGKHTWDIKVSDLSKSIVQRNLVALFFYALAALAVKLSLFCLYLRLFQVRTFVRRLIYVGMAACAVMYITSIIANCIWLSPLPGQPNTDESWLTRSGSTEHMTNKMAIAQGVFGTVSDLYLLLIPVESIMILTLPLAKRIGVVMVFSTGLIAIACSIGSLVYRRIGSTSNDQQWISMKIWILSSAEVTAGIVCSCMPVCVAFFRGHLKTFLSSFSQRYFSRFRTPRKSSKTRSSDASQLPNTPADNAKPRRHKRNIDTESADNLFSTQTGSGWEGVPESIELQRVVVR